MELQDLLKDAETHIRNGVRTRNVGNAKESLTCAIALSLLVLAECAVRESERNTTVITGGDDEIKINVGDGSDVPFQKGLTMKLSEVIKTLEHIAKCHPNSDPNVVHVDTVTDFLKDEIQKPDGFSYTINEHFFIVEEQQEDGSFDIVFRSWPY